MPQKKATSSSSPPKIYCPCCPQWEIKSPERCSNTLAYQGRTLYFCTKRCKDRFEKNPEKFLPKTA